MLRPGTLCASLLLFSNASAAQDVAACLDADRQVELRCEEVGDPATRDAEAASLVRMHSLRATPSDLHEDEPRTLSALEGQIARALQWQACRSEGFSRMQALYRLGRLHFDAMHLDEAVRLFAEVAAHPESGELTSFATMLQIDALNRLMSRGRACERELLGAVERAWVTQCSAAHAHSEHCETLARVRCIGERRGAEALAGAGRFQEAARRLERGLDMCTDRHERESISSDLVVYAIAAHDPDLARRQVDSLRERASALWPGAVENLGNWLFAQADYPGARDVWIQVRDFVTAKCSPLEHTCAFVTRALERALSVTLALGEIREASTVLGALERMSDAPEAALHFASVAEARGQTRRARAAYAHVLERYPAAEAHLLAEAHLGHYRTSARHADAPLYAILELARRAPELCPPEQRRFDEAIGEARFRLGERAFEAFGRAGRIAASGLPRREREFEEARALFDRVAVPQSTWILAAATRLAEVRERFADDLDAIGVDRTPSGTTVETLRAGAIDAFEFCFVTGTRTHWLNEWTQRCADALERLDRLRPLDELLPDQAWEERGEADANGVEEAQRSNTPATRPTA